MEEANGRSTAAAAAPGDAASADDVVANPSVGSGRKVTFGGSLPKLDKEKYNGIGMGMMEQQGTKSPIVTCVFEDDVRQRSFLQHFSLAVMWILWFSYYPLKFTGFVIEYMLNFLSHNGGLLGLLYRVFILEWGRIKFPHPDGDDYYSCIGHLDPRNNLYIDDSKSGKAQSTQANAQIFPFEHIGARSTADVCVMAAKLAYENKAVVKRIVEQTWKMHFVGFWNCWNEHQKMASTQVFVFTDKPVDANAVVVAWRGTEPFNAYDWITDLDFQWVKFSNHMGIHMGFLEALGLGSRTNKQTFKAMGMNAAIKRHEIALQEYLEANYQEATHVPGTPRPPPTPHHKSKQEIKKTKPTSGLSEDIVQEKDLAYDKITKTVCKILLDNPNAKVFITGHSLGGALATLYATMLHCSGETEMTSKIAAVYTFGQPRVGDIGFANYARRKFDNRYYRVVYCNDMVPRVPFDSNHSGGVDNDEEPHEDQVFAYKHFGKCAYFNSVYDGKLTRDPPNRNFFGYPGIFVMPLTAVWELYQSLMIMTTKYGTQYKETSASIIFRVFGLLLPGVAAHSPCNYVNSVRLGPNFPLAEQLADDVADAAADAIRDVLFVSEDLQDIYNAMPSVPGKDNWKLALEKIRKTLLSENPLQTHASADSISSQTSLPSKLQSSNHS